MIVWLASYPRSGNTFLRILFKHAFDVETYSLYNDFHDIDVDEDTSNIVGHKILPDDYDLNSYRQDTTTYYIKTHELPDERIQGEDKIIYMVRDGRQCIKSFHKYVNTYSDQNKSVIDVINGNVFSGSWGQHISSWARLDNEILYIKYEEIISRTDEVLIKISSYLDLAGGEGSIPTFEELKRINPSFFSEGKTDTWKEYFTEMELICFWLKNHSEMFSHGYTDHVPEAVSNAHSLDLYRALSIDNLHITKMIHDLSHKITYLHKQAYETKISIKTMHEEMNKSVSILVGKFIISIYNKIRRVFS